MSGMLTMLRNAIPPVMVITAALLLTVRIWQRARGNVTNVPYARGLTLRCIPRRAATVVAGAGWLRTGS
jgi:hypothetical protein